MSDNGAALWANSGCKMGQPLSTYDQDTWSAAPFSTTDLVTEVMERPTPTPDRDGGSGGATG